jgi:pyrroline-5-carboxylate reductase
VGRVNLSATTVAVLGAGAMGEAVLAGALRSGVAPEHLTATARRPERAQHLAERFGVPTTADNAAAAAGADVVVLAVKPKDMAGLVAVVGPALRPGAVVVSVAAGLSTAWFEDRLPAGTAVVRVMPNTPSAIGAGASAVSGGGAASPEQVDLVEAVLRGSGVVVRVAEKDQDAAAAVSGSGPAYVFYVVDAMTEAGVLVGLQRDLARRLAVQTVLGAAQLLGETGEHPVILRERVTSPGGTTAAALRALDDRGVRAAFADAIEAARDRSRELAAELSRPGASAAAPASAGAPAAPERG